MTITSRRTMLSIPIECTMGFISADPNIEFTILRNRTLDYYLVLYTSQNEMAKDYLRCRFPALDAIDTVTYIAYPDSVAMDEGCDRIIERIQKEV